MNLHRYLHKTLKKFLMFYLNNIHMRQCINIILFTNNNLSGKQLYFASDLPKNNVMFIIFKYLFYPL